ncbi:hypothetical protein ACE6H2_019607 [Prunus campanulata]
MEKFIDNLPAMDLMRSEKMTFVQLIIPVESAHRAISYLGELGLLQFRDEGFAWRPILLDFNKKNPPAFLMVFCLGRLRNVQYHVLSYRSSILKLNADKSPFQRTFVNQVKRCAEMSRKLRFFRDQISKAGLLSSVHPVLQPDIELEELEIQLAEHEHELIEMNSNSDRLQHSYNELLEFKMVLQKASGFLVSSNSHAVPEERELDENVYSNDDYSDSVSLLEQDIRPGPSDQSGLSFVSGIICKSKALRFERMLFRATRGNMLFNQASADEQIMDPLSTEMVEKTVFVVFFSGLQAKTKILKICEAFGANCYPVPEDITKQRQITREVLIIASTNTLFHLFESSGFGLQVSSRLAELEETLDAGIRHRNKALTSVGFHLAKWMNMLYPDSDNYVVFSTPYQVRREKAVYDTLNMLNFDVTKKCLVGEGWCPIFAKTKIQEALQRATFDSNSQVGIIFHVTDAIESPPTFFRTNRFTSAFQEIVDAYGVARYQEANPAVYTCITFPFLFAVMFGDWGHGICLLLGALILIARESKLSAQKLGSFMEMLFGGRYVLLLMSLFSIYCGLIYNEFFSVPFHIFGGSAYKCRDTACSEAYTIGLIKYRDPYPFGVDPSWRGSRSELPFLNSLKMKMSILLGVAQMNLGILLSYFNARFFSSSIDIRYQFVPQIIFLNSLFGYLSLLIVIKWCTGSQADLYHGSVFADHFVAFGSNCSSMDALSKTFYFEEAPYRGRAYGMLGTSEMDLDVEPDSARQHHEEFNFSEVFVHQMIHSIEFVLGAVSNTASYLRLWALSLAHSELSTVFYEKVLLLAWGYDNFVIRLIGLAVFAFATAFILLMMETLSAFLHALRLHWVEYQNKFYYGDGYKFKPFSFASITEDED